jgi:hypothetical protein
MSFDFALRATEVLLALAFLQQSAEHVFGGGPARRLFALRLFLALALLSGVQSAWSIALLSLHSLAVLHRFQGPYNGGSDRMGLLILYSICFAHWLPAGLLSEVAFGYLAVQVLLSYFISGRVKIVNADWRSGQALADVFAFSAYPVSEGLRSLAAQKQALFVASWAVMLFEVLFPLALMDQSLLIGALGVAAVFHLANACLFGLNRFLWFWIAAYPSILWLQARLVQGA